MEQDGNRIIFADIETGGFDFDSPIIELAAIAVQGGTYEELDTIDMKIEFNTKDPTVNLDALGVNKFSPSAWEKYAIPPEAAAEKYAAFLRRHATVERESNSGNTYTVAKLAAHNHTFDGPFIENWFKKHGPRRTPGKDPFYPALRLVLCTVQKADWFFQDNPTLTRPDDLKLPTLAKYFGLSTPDHSALNDIRTTVELARIIAEYQRIGVMPQAA